MRFIRFALGADCGPDAAAPPEFLDFLRHWRRLALSTRQGDPFCCAPLWHLAFHEAFSPRRRIFFASAPGAAVIFAEKIFAPGLVALTPLEAHWFYGTPVLGPGGVDLLAACMDVFAREYAPHFPRILVGGLRTRGCLARRLLERFRRHFAFYRHSRAEQCAASLHGGVDGFLSRRSARQRAGLRGADRRAAREGVVFERERPSTVAGAAEIYRRMLDVELRSWKGIGRCGMAESPAKEFYGVMLRRLALTGEGRVIFARHDGRDVGFVFGGMAGRIYRGQQFSYDNEWRRASIGNLLQLKMIEWLCEEGAARYDMGPLLGPKMEYKRHWTEVSMPMETWIMELEAPGWFG